MQIACADYLRYQYPHVLWCHIGNERHTSPARGAKLKKMGVKAGMPDILIFHTDGRGHHGVAIELKIKPNKLTKAQKEVLNDLSAQGWVTAVVEEFCGFKKLVDSWLASGRYS